MKSGFIRAAAIAMLALPAALPAVAQVNLNPLSGATPTLNQNVNLPGRCSLRVIVPLDRSNPAVSVSASVTVEISRPGNLRPVALGSPRVDDEGSRVVFTFDRPVGTCNQQIRATPTVTCSADMVGAGVTQIDNYTFPSSAGFSPLTEVTIPRSC